MAAKKGKEIRERHASDRIFNAAVIILSITTFIVIAYPLWFIVIASISNSNMVNQGKVILWPVDIRFYGYQQIWEDSRIWTGYLNTLIYVVVGTVLNLVVTLPAAYALSRPDFKARNAVMMYFVFTMYFSGGLVPLYMTIKSIGFIGNRWIMILMVLVNTYNLIIARTFIQNTIPNDLYEAAQLDGCSHFTFLGKVVLPLSKAIISVEVLYYAVYHWNDYFTALMYTNNDAKIQPLQTVLRQILLLNESYANGNGGVQGGYGQSSADQVKYAVIIVSTVPILCVYPFVQKYFEKGVIENNYYLVVGRFVPENNYEAMIRGFMASNSDKDFVLITNVEENKFYDKLRQETGFDKDPRVKFVGTVYDQELLKYIRENAFAYFHGHEVGGTNPSLLEALESTKLNLLLDVGFNREVGEDGALYWKKDQLASVIDQAEQLDEQAIEDLNQKSSKRIAEAFTWEKIVTDYEKVFKG